MTTNATPPAQPPAGNPWISQHKAQLASHVSQCAPRRGTLAAVQWLDALHASFGSRFLTTVCTVAAVLLLPLVWIG